MFASPLTMSKEMNAPVLPESRKVNATVVDSLTLTGKYSFVLNTEFTEAIQMNQREHACLCRPAKPMTHFCCPGLSQLARRSNQDAATLTRWYSVLGCLEGRYRPLKEDMIDLQRVLGGYDFDQRDPVLGMSRM